jgi:uncharacterized metal-binding protein
VDAGDVVDVDLVEALVLVVDAAVAEVLAQFLKFEVELWGVEEFEGFGEFEDGELYLFVVVGLLVLPGV